jgi:hypothetical protein
MLFSGPEGSARDAPDGFWGCVQGCFITLYPRLLFPMGFSVVCHWIVAGLLSRALLSLAFVI